MTPSILFPTLLVAAALGGIVYTLLSRLEERSVVRDTLRQLDGYELENQRDSELLVPLADRALMPVLHGLTDLGRRFTPVGYVEKVRLKFVYAGEPSAEADDRFLAVRAVTADAAVLSVIITFFTTLIPGEGTSKLLVGGLLVMIFLIGPDSWLNRK